MNKLLLSILVFVFISPVFADQSQCNSKSENCIAISSYKNPVDQKVYQADWKKYYPDTPQGTSSLKKVESLSIRLLNTDDELKRNISAQDISNHVKSVDAIVEEVFSSEETQGNLLISVDVFPTKKPIYNLMHDKSLSSNNLQTLYEQLNTIDPIYSKESVIKFQITYNIK